MEVDIDSMIMDINDMPLTENDKSMIKNEEFEEDLEEILSSPHHMITSNSDDIQVNKMEAKPVVPIALTKIAPKPISTSKTVPGQIVVIQGPGGSTQQIRISSSTSTQSPSGPIQLIKTADGKFLRISSTKKSNTTAPSNSSTQVKPQATRIIAKNNAGQTIIPNTVTQTAGSASLTPTGVKRTFTVAQAQQMGLISSAKLKELVSQATAQKQARLKAPSSPITSNASTTNAMPSSSKLVSQKVIIQTSSGEQKQVALPPNLIKLAQSGQIKAVNVAGKGIQYVRVMGNNSSSNTSSTSTTIVKPSQAATKLVPVSSKVFVQNRPNPNQNSNTKFSLIQTPKQMTIGNTVVKSNSNQEPSRTVVQVKKLIASNNLFHPTTSKDAVRVKEEEPLPESEDSSKGQFNVVNKPKLIKVETPPSSPKKNQNLSIDPDEDDVVFVKNSQSSDEGIRRKHCNCNKSMCLKLYCDCFANGEFCFNCNCKECFNNLENEEERQRAIRICLERNPAAFKPKIGKARDQLDSANRKHTKGCNCKRSGCLKNYCECYEAKIACSDNCKCIGCRNIDMDESMYDNNTSTKMANNSFDKSIVERSVAENRLTRETTPPNNNIASNKRSCNFMTSDVIEATIQCVIAQAEECQKNNMASVMAEKMILEEFGRCLIEIIEFSNKSGGN